MLQSPNDIVIHIRCGDAPIHGWNTVQFYEEALKVFNLKGKLTSRDTVRILMQIKQPKGIVFLEKNIAGKCHRILDIIRMPIQKGLQPLSLSFSLSLSLSRSLPCLWCCVCT